MAFIEIDNITFQYPIPNSPPALRGLSLHIAEGEYVAIVGANGSGKSTLARHLNALLIPTSGTVRVARMDTRDVHQHPDIRREVGMVFQRPDDQVVATTVADDVAFGPENLGLPPSDIRERVEQALEAVKLGAERDRPPHMLSAGQVQRLALAGVLAMRPRCIVFDEATAMLDPGGRRVVRAMMCDLHQAGLTIISITHFMDEAAEAERVVVLDAGRVVLDGTPQVVFANVDALQALGLDVPPAVALAQRLRGMGLHLPPDVLSIPALADALVALPQRADDPTLSIPIKKQPQDKATLIAVRDLGHIYMRDTPLARRALQGVNLHIPEGGAHGLLGATGSGKSTLMQHLNGLLCPQEGCVQVGDFDLGDPSVDVQVVRRWVGLSFQMPEMQIFEQYVGDEIAYGPRLQGLPRPALRARVRWAMDIVGLDFEAFKDRLTFTLSGGQKRKVALASTLALQPHILLLDEPTAGLDPRARKDVLARLQALCNGKMTLLLSSHQMADVAQLATHVTVLDDGTSVLEGAVSQVFAQGERLRALGLGLPPVTQVSELLRARGWLLPAGLVDEERFVHLLGWYIHLS